MSEIRYVERNAAGLIVGEYAHPHPGRAEEALPEDHPDIVAFRRDPRRAFAEPLPAPRVKGGPRRVA